MSSAIGEMLRKVAERAFSETRKKYAGPYVVDDPVEPSKAWAVASDGQVIVWTQIWKPTVIAGCFDKDVLEVLLSIFAPSCELLPAWEGRLGDLQKFCGAPVWSEPCPECKGISKASEYVMCSFCDNDGEVFPEARCGFVCGISVNLICLANVLEHFAADAIVQIIPDVREEGFETGKGSRVWVMSRDFCVCLMTLEVAKHETDDLFEAWKTAPSFPVCP